MSAERHAVIAEPPDRPASGAPLATERVLPTLNLDGSRRWIHPRPAHGRHWRMRRAVAAALIAVFVLLPLIRIGGRPAVLLDLPARRFTLFGTTFLPSETVLFMLFVLSAMLAVFLVTALFGRVWCGWACPQTVYMEFLFRPVERWIEGGWRGRERITVRHPLPRRITKWVIFAALSFVLAHVFLAYFVPVGELLQWMRRSPVEHPTSFLIVLGTTALVLFDFGWFREQTCLVACPYGRLQSALLDRRSLIVGYDARRGEPRARRGPQREAGAGDCVDCRSCVLTCPTGIDIREGLQMECIHCTQCMDACDYVMTKIGRPTGLIRYASQDGLDGRASRRLRPRVVLYPAALALCVTLLVVGLSTRTHPDVTLLHGLGVAYTRGEGDAVVNQVRIKVANRTATTGHYRIALLGAPEATMIVPIDPMPVAPGAMATQSVFVSLPPGAFRAGERAVRFRISDERGWSETLPYRLVGPEPGEGGHAEPAEGRR